MVEIEKLLSLLNSWWIEGRVKEEMLKAYKREIWDDVLGNVDNRQLVIITGLRRVGKSTVFFQLIDHLIKKEVSPKNILYFSFDEAVDDPIKILSAYSDVTGISWKNERLFIFFDEIQKLPSWSSKVKLIYDNFPKIKLFLSGSASVILEKEASLNLAGRHFLLRMDPLSLKEFFEMKTGKILKNEEIGLWKHEMKPYLKEYLKKPFPEAVEWNDEMKVREYIRETVISKVIAADVPKIFRNVNTKILLDLVELFFSKPGMLFDINSFSRDMKIGKATLLRHMYYLEFSLLIRIVKNYRPSALSASRKLKKIYPHHWSLMLPFSFDTESGSFFEAAVSSMANASLYWRDNEKEVDFILRRNGKILPLEAKYSVKVTKDDLKSMAYFMKRFKADKGLVIYRGDEKTREGMIEIIPFLDFCLKRFIAVTSRI